MQTWGKGRSQPTCLWSKGTHHKKETHTDTSMYKICVYLFLHTHRSIKNMVTEFRPMWGGNLIPTSDGKHQDLSIISLLCTRFQHLKVLLLQVLWEWEERDIQRMVICKSRIWCLRAGSQFVASFCDLRNTTMQYYPTNNIRPRSWLGRCSDSKLVVGVLTEPRMSPDVIWSGNAVICRTLRWFTSTSRPRPCFSTAGRWGWPEWTSSPRSCIQ